MIIRKCKANIINNSWEIMKENVNFIRIPNKDELIVIDKLYYKVINVIHDFDNKSAISIIISKI